jgi:aminopeptidase-like protein
MQEKLSSYFHRLWPICRSITGDGLRESFKILQELMPLELTEVPSGTEVHDWTIPQEWNIKDAYIVTPQGKRVAEFRVNNLHVLNYSEPINAKVSFEELAAHVYTLPEMPTAIPYVTSYYERRWGFCMAHEEFEKLPKEGTYQVVIDSELKNGSLTYGQVVLPGNTSREVVISSYLCHPSMANNELSGPLVMAMLYQQLAALENRKFTYRFVLAPETIGVIAFLSHYGPRLMEHCEAGWVLTCCGDSGPVHFKKSRRGNSLTDRISKHVLNSLPITWNELEFSVGGSDERQYCSPGYNLPIGSFMRTPYQKYPEYHTSLDNVDFISFAAMEESVELMFQIILGMEMNETYRNKIRFGEPQLGKRGLYPNAVMPNTDKREIVHNMMHFLNWAEGELDLLDIAEKRGTSIFHLAPLAIMCEQKGVVEKV